MKDRNRAATPESGSRLTKSQVTRTRTFVGSTIVFLSLAATASALWNPSGDKNDPQQLRNFRDVLKVDSFRSTPTPTPTPKPTPTPSSFSNAQFVTITVNTQTWNSNRENNDDDPPGPVPHPLADFFKDVANAYCGNVYSDEDEPVNFNLNFTRPLDDNLIYVDYPKLARALRPAGNAIENLITEKGGPKRFLRARTVSRGIEAAVRATVENYGFDFHQNPYRSYWNTFATGPDYRGLALAFASDLRKASKNAAAHRPLTAGLPIRRHKLQLIVTYARNSYPIQVVRMDGRGGSTVTALAAPPVPDYDYTSSSGVSVSSGTLVLNSGTGLSSTPTPTPSN